MSFHNNNIRKVAERAGVSIATVSRVLNEKRTNSYSDDTAEKVRRAAQELGYRPNLLMRGVAGRSTHTIGVLVPPAGGFYEYVVQGIHDSLAGHDYAMLLVWSTEYLDVTGSDTELKQLHRMIDRRVDGIILRPTHDSVSDLYFREVWERRIPLVTVDRAILGVHCDFAGTDDAAVGRLAAEHLLGKGHRRLGHLAGPRGIRTARSRRESFERTVAAFGDGADCVTVEAPDFWGRGEAEQILRSEPQPTAIFAANDDLAENVYIAAAKLGICIPRDLTVVGCGDLLKARYLKPPLTTFNQNPHLIGQEAVRLLLDNINGNNDRPSPRQVRVPPRLVVRGST